MRVLIVDDDESFCRILREVLAGLGCRPDYAVSLAEARRRLLRREHDVVLLDFRFPEGDGLELMGMMQDAGGGRGSVPVVVVSGHQDALAEARFFAAGGLAWIRKPFTSSALVEKLEEVARLRAVRGQGS